MSTAIVILAAAGVFGESRGNSTGQSASIAISVEYPTKSRYKQINPMRVLVTNRSARLVDTLTVVLDSAYISRFSNVTFSPSASRAWEVDLTDLRAGETRRINVGLQGERYGRHAGAVSAFFARSDTATADVRTVIFS